MNSKIHEKHPNISDNITIPVVFIDPVLHIYKDPCDPQSLTISDTERKKFDEYTSRLVECFKLTYLQVVFIGIDIHFLSMYRFLDVIEDIPRFQCTERCKAPDSFYSGAPILTHPENGVIFIENDDDSTKFLEWQIWTSILKTDDFVIKINEKVIDHNEQGTTDGLTYSKYVQFLGKFMKVVLKVQAESDAVVAKWKIELKNAKGGWNFIIIVYIIFYSQH